MSSEYQPPKLELGGGKIRLRDQDAIIQIKKQSCSIANDIKDCTVDIINDKIPTEYCITDGKISNWPDVTAAISAVKNRLDIKSRLKSTITSGHEHSKCGQIWSENLPVNKKHISLYDA